MAVTKLPSTVIPCSSFRKQVEGLSGQKVSSCFRCQKCTNGCPMTFAMDIVPHKLMHSIQLGLQDEVLNSDTIWVCASCATCTTRCPNDIDIAHIMDALRRMSKKQGVKDSQKQAPIFHKEFLSGIKRLGRMHEASMTVSYALKSEGIKGLGKQFGLGLEMMRKGKIKIIPDRLSAGKQVKEIFKESERKGR